MNILVEKNLRVPLRDGVLLATDLYRNADGSAAPVLVMRLPYDKERFVNPEVMALVQNGFHLVHYLQTGRCPPGWSGYAVD